MSTPAEPRRVDMARKTNETNITLALNLDGSGQADVRTGIGFLDHMITALSKHSRIDLTIHCQGDLHIDDHHTAEDTAIVLGQALDKALGDKAGIPRFGFAYAPLDEALARVVIDLSGRPFADVNLKLSRSMIGQIACENISHFFRSLAMSSRMCLHVDIIKGENDHHQAEAAFKGLALALKQAIHRTGCKDIPSTKGVL